MYTMKSIAHVEALLDAPPVETIMGKLLTCLVEDLKVEVGLPSILLQYNYQWLHYAVMACWLTHIWEFLHSGQVKIFDPLPDLPLGGEGDQQLMAVFLSQGAMHKKLLQLNMCRIYLCSNDASRHF